ncbi:LOW QUALITY PROTEIN: ribosomal RNA processing protein 36 homolog [Manduca sexta]|uniref:LOW QUALITY PROTEIN: ribosomal RNA processing protein 36 homolog n=1 Tax=Manduca sexta TaxID=7130 RepID=UPI00188FD743|nr:LOW QUALITY PROTEIN: ribosomal RNA processing protein 36 homolog [Manduca sexta]
MSDSEDNSSVEQHNDSDDRNDEERMAIRSQLSTLSFEELQKLKEKIGAKVYKEALFGNKMKDNKPKVFKRDNKNRPREMSSKKPVPMLQATKVKKKEIRDPRFDPLCGEFDKKQFNENYGFLSNIRINDIKAVKSRLKEATDPEESLKLRRLLQRLNDQHKESRKSRKEKEMAEKKKQEIEQQFREGKQPVFKNKSEQRVEALVKQYEDLKKEGTSRVQRHLMRRQQKIKKRSFKAPTGV